MNEDNIKANEPDIITDDPTNQNSQNIINQVLHTQSGMLPPQVLEKITSEHLSDIVRNEEKNQERAFQYAREQRWWNAFYTILFFAFLFFAFYYLTETFLDQHPEYYDKILAFIAGIFTGGGSTFAIQKYFKQE